MLRNMVLESSGDRPVPVIYSVFDNRREGLGSFRDIHSDSDEPVGGQVIRDKTRSRRNIMKSGSTDIVKGRIDKPKKAGRVSEFGIRPFGYRVNVVENDSMEK